MKKKEVKLKKAKRVVLVRHAPAPLPPCPDKALWLDKLRNASAFENDKHWR